VADYTAHIEQSIKNLQFLQNINNTFPDSYDWQITVCFYVAVHLVNAHLAKSHNLHCRSHEDVKLAISPTNPTSLCRIDERPYTAYEKLSNNSRRARYLISEDHKDDSAHYVSEKYIAKSIRELDKVIIFFAGQYGIKTIPKIKVKCDRLKEDQLMHFEVV